MAAPRQDTLEWQYTAAQTDALMKTLGANEIMQVTYAKVVCANSNTADVSVRIGFVDATTLPSNTPDSGTPAVGVFFSHGGIARGGGEVSSNGGAAIATSKRAQKLRITCSAPTGGSLRVIMTGRVLTDQDQVGEV